MAINKESVFMEGNIKNRIEWVDIAKGLGMLLVIMGHSISYTGMAFNLIYAFHMPLFFILSGIFNKEDSIKNIIKDCLNRLLIPSVLFFMIGIFITVIIPYYRHSINLYEIFIELYFGYPATFKVGSLWFVICLFEVSVVFAIVKKIKKIYFQIVVILLLIVFGFAYAYLREINYFSYIPGRRLPLKFDVALIALLFYAAGSYGKNLLLYITTKYERNIILQLLILILCVAITICCAHLNGSVNIANLEFKNPVIYILGAIFGSIGIISLSVIINKIKFLSVFMQYIGRHTIIILGLQSIGCNLYVDLINKITKSEYLFMNLPLIHIIGSFVSVTVLSLVICLIVGGMNKKWMQIKNSRIQKAAQT